MTQVHKIYQYDDASTQSSEQNKFEMIEKIVDDIVEQGIPNNLSFSDFVVSVSKNYGINVSEAKTCIKLALNEMGQEENAEKSEQDELYGQCGYYYPSGYNTTSAPKAKNDGMDSLACLGSYNRLMFLK